MRSSWGPLLVALGLLPCLSAAEVIAYVSDPLWDGVLRLRDLNRDGDAKDAGESSYFFGPGNLSGYAGIGNAQALLVLGKDDILAAESEESGLFMTRVLRLRDLNGDGDAQDPGEATLFWDSWLPIGVNYDRVKALLIGPDGALYAADNNDWNLDYDTPEAVWRLDDRNGDGHIVASEVALYVELSTVGDRWGFSSEDYAWTTKGDLLFTNKTTAANDINLWAIEPGDETGNDLHPLAKNSALPGVACNWNSLTVHPLSDNPVLVAGGAGQRRLIVELVDSNGNGWIDGPNELLNRYASNNAVVNWWWDTTAVTDLAYAPDRTLWLLDDSPAKRILRLTDLDGDGLYHSAGELATYYVSATSPATSEGQPALALRTVAFAAFANPDFDGDGAVDAVDAQRWTACLAGPGTAVPNGCLPGDFLDADLDGDADVDLHDYVNFQRASTPLTELPTTLQQPLKFQH